VAAVLDRRRPAGRGVDLEHAICVVPLICTPAAAQDVSPFVTPA